MSNEYTQMTQFQQRAQLRLQEMEVEWRKTLFERFRTICREEMMDVMKALLESMQSPQELEKKLAELQQSAHSNQMELFSTVAETSEQVRNLAKKLEAQPSAAPDPHMMETIARGQEAISKEVVSKQEESTRQIQEDVRNSAQLSRSTLTKAVLITTAAVLVLCAMAVLSLRFLSPATVISETELQERASLQKQVGTLAAELKAQRTEKTELQKEMQELTARRDALQADIRQATETQRTAAANLSTLQQQITNLQQLQEQFRFKLVKGESGGVFVEIPPEAQPFQYAEKTFIQVK